MYSFPPTAAPLSRELPAYTQLHHHDVSAGSCWGALLQTRLPEFSCLFFILLHSSLCSALCLSEHESTLGIYSHGFR